MRRETDRQTQAETETTDRYSKKDRECERDADKHPGISKLRYTDRDFEKEIDR